VTAPDDPKGLARRRAALSPERQEAVARRLRGEAPAAPAAAAAIPPRPERGWAPLSFAQERLWFLDELEPGNPAFNENVVLRLRGELRPGALERALAELVRRHESLRTSVVTVDGRPRQVIHELPDFAPRRASLLDVAPAEREAELGRLAGEEARAPFDLSRAPLFRATLFELGPADHALVLCNHHIVSDGWSRAVLVRELVALYEAFARGEPPRLPAPPIQYGDYATWQRLPAQAERADRHLAYWRDQLKAPLATLGLPADNPRPPVATYRGGVVHFGLPPALGAAVEQASRREGATPFMVLLAAFVALLHRHAGQADVVVGSAASNRDRPETEGVVGLFVNSLVLRADLAGDPPFVELLARVKKAALGAYAHAELPFERLVEELKPPRDPSRAPLYQVMFTLQNVAPPRVELGGLAVEVGRADAGTSRLDLTLELVPDVEGALRGQLEYNADLFERATVERLAARYATLLEAALDRPDAPVSRLALMPEAERRLALEAWNDLAPAPPPAGTVVAQFEAQARRTPDAPALAGAGLRLSYRELDERSNRLARVLEREGVGPEARVAVCLGHGPELVVALWAVLKAGGAYVPLNPDHPRDRLAFALDDSRAALLLTNERWASAIAAEGVKVLRLEQAQAAIEAASPGPLPARASAENAAYLIYTSGSTGRPKGVVVGHANLLNFFRGIDEKLGTERGTWLALTNFAFDISVLELLWTLARGFEVVVPGPDDRDEGPELPAKPARELALSLFFFASDASAGGGDKYRLLLEAARFADENHFAAVWTPERHFHSFGGLYPSPAVVAGALAVATRRVRIRAGSVVLPLHDAVRVAEDWSVVDNLSGGRVDLSFASGWHADDFVFAPERYEDRRRQMALAVDDVRKLWRGESVTRRGGTGREIEVRTLPRPLQKELPVWVTASGDPKTFELAGSLGAGVLTHLLGQSVEELGAKIAAYRAAWRAAGRGGEGHVTLMLHTFVGDDLAAVREAVRGPFCDYLRTSLDLVKNLARSLNVDTESADFTADDLDALIGHAFERYFQTSGLMGTVESCLKMAERLRAAGVDELACLVDFGVDPDAVLRALPKLDELRRACNAAPAAAERSPLVSHLLRRDVTHFQCTPSVARLVVEEAGVEAFSGLRALLVGGEALPPALARELAAHVPEVHNMYGPTETTIWSSGHRLAPGDAAVPIGRPVAGNALYVLDANLEPAPVGVPGELYVGGEGVARGYHGRPGLTAERFLPDPFGPAPGRRMYRTGDVVRFRHDGALEFLGRNDHQIKLRGFRIELGEIEAALGRHPGVRQAVVAVGGTPADPRLVGFVVGRWGMAPAAPELQAFLRERLPDYMVPAAFVALEALPRTPNGKLDRRALPMPDLGQRAVETEFVAPRTELERRLAELWAQALRVDRVGVHDNFFELGGHSLLATQLVAKVRSTLRVDLPLRYFIERPTVAGLAEAVEGRAKPEAAPPPPR
jgi:natural product biosynthesis luciferase-like monooxygenase protein